MAVERGAGHFPLGSQRRIRVDGQALLGHQRHSLEAQGSSRKQAADGCPRSVDLRRAVADAFKETLVDRREAASDRLGYGHDSLLQVGGHYDVLRNFDRFSKSDQGGDQRLHGWSVQ